MRVFIIGGAGGIGAPLTRILTERGDEVSGMHRRSEQAATVHDAGGVSVLGDLVADDVAALAARMVGHDAVVFSAGAHGTGLDQTSAIDGDGLVKAAEAAERAGVRRFVLVSVFPDAGRGKAPSAGFEHYMQVKKAADVHLAGTDLDWVIVRPGTLVSEPGDGRVRVGLAVPYGSVRRENVAHTIAAVLAEPTLNHVILEVTDGPVAAPDAVAALASQTHG